MVSGPMDGDVTLRDQTNRLLIKGKDISMVIHCTDPHQCHIIAVLFRQNGSDLLLLPAGFHEPVLW